MNFRPGTIYHLRDCAAAYPKKDKFVVCISSTKSFFFFINSVDAKRPYAHEQDHIVFLGPYRVQCLSHKSYINVSIVSEIQQNKFSDACEKESLSNDLLIKIRDKVTLDKKLSRELKNIILEELKYASSVRK
jgi:hypothetical protein